MNDFSVLQKPMPTVVVQNTTTPQEAEETKGNEGTDREPGQMIEPADQPSVPAPVPEQVEKAKIEGISDEWQTAAETAINTSVKVNGESGFFVDYDPDKKLAYILTTQDVVEQGAADGKIAVVLRDGNAVVGTVYAESDHYNRADFFLGANLALITIPLEERPETVRLQTAAPNLGEEVLVSAHTNQPNTSAVAPEPMGNEIAMIITTVSRNLSPGNFEPEMNIIGNGGLVLEERHADSSLGGGIFNSNGELVGIVVEELDLGEHTFQRVNRERVTIEGGSIAIPTSK